MARDRRTWGRVFALIGAGALAVAACGGDDSDDGAAPDTVESAGSADATNGDATGATTAGTAAAGPGDTTGDRPASTQADSPGTTAAGETGEPAGGYDLDASMTFMYLTAASSNYDPVTGGTFSQLYMYPALDALFRLRDGQPEPALASGYEVSDDGLTATLTIRDGVSFHDGTPLDAAAVVANIERAKTLETSTVANQLTSIDTATAVDASTVEIALTAPDAALPAILADRAGMMLSPATFDRDDIALNPVGAGPYAIVEHQPGDFIRYERFADYWDPEVAKLAELTIRIQTDDNTRLTALRSGDVDAAPIPPTLLPTAEGEGLEVEAFQTGATFMTYLNMATPPLDDPLVRRAMSLAIDREGINQALEAGTCTPSNQALSPPNWAHDPDATTEWYQYDPDRARELLAEAGHPDGFEISMVVFPTPSYVARAEAVQAQLAEIGVDVALAAVEGAQVTEQFRVNKTAAAYTTLFPGEADPAIAVGRLYGPTGTLNPGGTVNPEIAALMADGLTASEADRAAIYQQIGSIAADQVLHIPLCGATTLVAQQRGVVGIEANNLDILDLSRAGILAGD
ncbi:MAG TPA: ABC transporter substrate-binding protein [Ilumatobacter sp.]|nr:ABC transporter substrate-binding protein [Ilumatobacter sp.]